MIDDLTLYCLRQREFFTSPLFDHSGGAETGEPLLVRAHEQVEQLTLDIKSPLPESVQERIRRYCAEQYRQMGG